MYKILADASLPGLREAFPKPFEVTVYNQCDEVMDRLSGQDILFCRSNLKVNASLLKGCTLRYVATASSGIDHIEHAWLKTQGIALLDAKGSNTNAVADYVMATIAYLQKHKNFRGKTAGIIGLGAVGTQLLHRLNAINFKVIGYDPPKALQDTNFHSSPLAELLACDLICLHANLNDTPPYPSRHLLNESALTQLKPNAVIINASRGDIVSEHALLNLHTPIVYCTDVFSNEPQINEKIIDFSILCTPHIAGRSLEAKYEAVAAISQKLHHCYHLPLPHYAPCTVDPTPFFHEAQTWQDYVLSLYNPALDTHCLKQADNKEAMFLQLRKMPQNRHDFCAYAPSKFSMHMRAILGMS